MDTLKLRRLQQQPSRLEAMLDSLVANRDWIAPGAQRVYDRSELPSVLQKLAIKSEKGDGAWSCLLYTSPERYPEIGRASCRERV